MSKKITILGAGESGLGAALLGKKRGYDVFLSDRNKLNAESTAFMETHSINYEEGGHSFDQILAASLIVKSP